VKGGSGRGEGGAGKGDRVRVEVKEERGRMGGEVSGRNWGEGSGWAMSRKELREGEKGTGGDRSG